MSDDTDLKMYEIKAGLEEIKEEMNKIKKENTDLKNDIAFNHLMENVDNFERKYSKTLEVIQEKLSTLTTTVSNNHDIFTEIKEAIQVQTENEKSLVDDQAKLTRILEIVQEKVTTLSANASNNDGILSKVNEMLRKQNKEVQILKRNMKTMDKETILLLGRRSGGKVVDSLLILQNNGECYGNWKKMNITLPYALWGHGAQFLNNSLYIFGGENEKNEVLNWTYKLTGGHKWLTKNNLQWEKITDMNEKRTEILNSSVILSDQIWVIGGKNERCKALESVEMYDPETNIWTNMKPMNQCRRLAAAAVVNGEIFCCGGYNGFNFLISAEFYDPSSDVWTLISDMPGPNGGCGIVVMDVHLIVIGGKDSFTNLLNSVWILDTADKKAKWIKKEPCISFPRSEFSIAKIHDKIFVCGGFYITEETSTSKRTNDVEIFDGEVWRKGPRMPTHPAYIPAVVIPMDFAKFLN